MNNSILRQAAPLKGLLLILSLTHTATAEARPAAVQSKPPIKSVADQIEIYSGAITVAEDGVEVRGVAPSIRNEVLESIAALRSEKETPERINAFRERINTAYLTAGHLPVLTVPDKTFNGSGLRFVILALRFSDVDVSGIPDNWRSLVRQRLQPLLDNPFSKPEDVRHILARMASVPGLTLNEPEFETGEGAGVILKVSGKARYVSGLATANNDVYSDALVKGVTVLNVNNASGFGEQFNFIAGSSIPNRTNGQKNKQAPPTLGVNAVIPVSTTGFELRPNYNTSRSSILPSEQVIGMRSTNEVVGITLAYPTVTESGAMLGFEMTVDRTREQLALPEVDVKIARAHDSLRFASTYLGDGPFGTMLQGRAEFSKGLGGEIDQQEIAGLFGIINTPDYAKSRGSLKIVVPSNIAQYTLLLQGQTSLGKNIVSAERLALDGSDAVSPFPTGSYTADEGVTVRNEVEREIQLIDAKPYVFAAAGWGKTLIDPEKDHIRRLAAFGVGIRKNIDLKGGRVMNLQAEIGRRFSNDDQPPRYRVGFNAILLF